MIRILTLLSFLISQAYFRSDCLSNLWLLKFVAIANGCTIRQQPQYTAILPSKFLSNYHKSYYRHQRHIDHMTVPYLRRRFRELYNTKDENNEEITTGTNAIYYNDFDDDTTPITAIDSNKKSENTIWNQLRMRQHQLVLERIQQIKNVIKSGECKSKIGISISNDWIRRMSIHKYPYTIIGTSSDHIYLADIETGKLWGTSEKSNTKTSWTQSILSQRLQYATQQMFGMYDGGGTLAVAIYHTLLFEATRDGNVNIYRFKSMDLSDQSKCKSISDGGRGVDLISLGSFQSLKECLVTSLYCSNDDFIWIGTDTGRVEVYKLRQNVGQGEWTVADKQQSYRTYQVGTSRNSIVLSIHAHPSIKCAVATTDTGTIELLHYGDATNESNQRICTPISSYAPPLRDSMKRRAVNVYPTTATIIEVPRKITTVSNDDEASSQATSKPMFVIICGTKDGGLYLQKLFTSTTKTTINGQDKTDTVVNIHQPLMNTTRSMQPFHFEWVKCVTSMGNGLLLTGALDGTIRLWEIASSTTSNDENDNDESINDDNVSIEMIYQLIGYKVWLGSIWTDGKRIISDGADNTIIVHDFSKALKTVSSSTSTSSMSSFNDIDEDPFDTDDRPLKPPSSPLFDDDSTDDYPII